MQSRNWIGVSFWLFMVAYCLIALFSVMALWSTAMRVDGVLAPLGIGVGVATAILTGVWSGLGTGSFLKRLLLCYSSAALMASCFAVGTRIHFRSFELDEFFFGLVYALHWIPPFILAALLPFWMLRVAFGWQLVRCDESARVPFSLSDAFVMTFVCALAVAVPRMSVAFQEAGTTKRFGGITEPTLMATAVENKDGSFSFKDVLITPGNLEQIMDVNNRQIAAATYAQLKVSIVTILTGAVAAVPLVFLVFRRRKYWLVSGLGYAIACGLIASLAIGLLSMGSPAMHIGIGSTIIATFLPLATLRMLGLSFAE